MGLMDEFDRIVDRQVRDLAESERRKMQAIFDRLVREHGGEPVETCIAHVRAAFDEAGLIPDDDQEVRDYAETVSAGERIDITVTTDIRR